ARFLSSKSLICLSILRSRTWRAWIGIGQLTLQNDQIVACHSLAIHVTITGLSCDCHRPVVIIGKAASSVGQVLYRRDSSRVGATAQKLAHLAKESGGFRMRLLRR